MSRKLTSSFFISIDGVVEAPGEWHFAYHDQELSDVIDKAMAAADAMLMGRVSYEEWAAFWPDSGNPVAPIMNGFQKYVASTSLESVEWENSQLLGDDVHGEVAALKERDGGDIAMSGSATLSRSLMRAGLVDELHLMIHPLVVGAGDKLFEEGNEIKLELISSTTFPAGVVYCVYRPLAA